MRNQKPGNRKLAFGFPIFCFLFFIVCLPPSRVCAETGSAVVVGAERLFVRRGPGTEFPPFATLTKGDTVEVQEMQGEWARIMTGGGQTGYVRSNFLVLPGEHAKPSVPPSALPTPTAKSQPGAAAEPAALRTANARKKTLETEIRTLQQQIADLKSQSAAAATPVTPAVATPASMGSGSVTPVTTTAVTPPPTEVTAAATGPDELHAEIARLTAVVEVLQHRLEVRPPIEGLPAPTAPIEGAPCSWSSGLLPWGIIGLAIGWLGGSTFGRRPDRGRRSRLRF